MINNVLLCSEKYIKENSNLSDNVWGKFLLPAIREAQEIRLQAVIGTNLYQSLLSKVADGSISDQYKELLDFYVQPVMLYQVLSDVIDVLDIKMVNLGTVRSRDEYLDNISDEERQRLKSNYEFKADWYVRRLQQYLLDNRDLFVELDECACSNIKANLESAASSGIFLGGFRGRRIVGNKIISFS